MRRLASTVCLAAVFALGACRSETPPASVARHATPASASRDGRWLGGPEPLSGKLPSGLVTWWQLEPAQPAAGEPFELTVRIEEVRQAGAWIGIGAGDGAQLARSEDAGPWALPVGAPSQLSVRLTAPPGASYVHLTLHQGERTSVRSILLPLAGRNPTESARQRNDYATDAAGEPIVRMPADAAPR